MPVAGASASQPATGWELVRICVFLGFLALCFLGGGASRLDVGSLLYVRPAAIFAAACLLLVPGPFNWARVRAPFLFLGALALVMVIQLIPLPPDLWTALPGHERFADAATAAGLEQPWRPISISPDLTLNSLVSLTVPAAVLIGMASLNSHRAERLLLIFLVGAIVLSGVIGIAQVTRGANSSLYLYKVTNEGMAVGLFANRNHQAALLACAFPVLAAWACSRSQNPGADAARRWLAGAVGALIVPLIVVTGSRAGVPLGVIGLAAASLIFWVSRPAGGGGKAALLALAPWLIGFVLLLLSLLLSQAAVIQRFFATSIGEESRVQNVGLFVDMTRDFLPFGSGFGTFDPLFRIYEPFDHLTLEYLNHAHNDLLELLITAGVFGGVLLLAFLLWYFRKAWVTFRERRASGATLRIVGLAVITILLAGSIVDYPLRTPIMMAVFAIATVWFGSGGIPRQPAPRRSGGKALLQPDEALSSGHRGRTG